MGNHLLLATASCERPVSEAGAHSFTVCPIGSPLGLRPGCPTTHCRPIGPWLEPFSRPDCLRAGIQSSAATCIQQRETTAAHGGHGARAVTLRDRAFQPHRVREVRLPHGDFPEWGRGRGWPGSRTINTGLGADPHTWPTWAGLVSGKRYFLGSLGFKPPLLPGRESRAPGRAAPAPHAPAPAGLPRNGQETVRPGQRQGRRPHTKLSE
jgi:hypothetical protein